jgi:hypothetical protein
MRLLSPNPGVPVKLPKTLATVAGQLGLALLSLLLAVPAAADPATSPAGNRETVEATLAVVAVGWGAISRPSG